MPRHEGGFDVKIHVSPDDDLVIDALGPVRKGKKAKKAMDLIAVAHLVVRALRSPDVSIDQIIEANRQILGMVERGESLVFRGSVEKKPVEHRRVRMGGTKGGFE